MAEKIDWPEEDLTLSLEDGGGYYPTRLGELFEEGRFVVMRKLGWGGCSSVWLAKDRKESTLVALKLLSTSVTKEIESGRLREVEILQTIANGDRQHPGYDRNVHILHQFSFESFKGKHLCLVTNVLSWDVRSLLKEMEFEKLPLGRVIQLVKHVLEGLEYLHDECNIVHSDLKPGNIMLRPKNLKAIVMDEFFNGPPVLYDFPKLAGPDKMPFAPVVSCPVSFILNGTAKKRSNMQWVIGDFGHAHQENFQQGLIVQPRALRAPEVILGLPWGSPIDIWSLGCLMYEFAVGEWLFSPAEFDGVSEDIVHLSEMVHRTGQTHDSQVLQRFASKNNISNIEDLIARNLSNDPEQPKRVDDVLRATQDASDEVRTQLESFHDLMRSFLNLDPTARPTAKQALQHPIFRGVDNSDD